MRSRSLPALLCTLALAWQVHSSFASAIDIVRNREPASSVVFTNTLPEAAEAYAPPTVSQTKKAPTPKKGNGKAGDEIFGPDAVAVKLLVEWVRKMTETTLPATEAPTAGKTPIYVGYAAIQAGLKLDDIDSPSREGIRIVVDKEKILIAGQTAAATHRAACRFLEEFGCRVFMDGEIGEVYPQLTTLATSDLNITEKPAFVYRNPKGPNWGSTAWRLWNGAGGTAMHHSHAWGGLVSTKEFEAHPEYFAMGRNGQRTASGWFCTSNPELRRVFADRVLEKIQAGERNPSLSPSDGNGYCQCESCKAQDDPKALEPSSGTISITNRYASFFNDVGRRVSLTQPNSILSFYCYADYTQPPTSTEKLSPNLCAFIAPIRYCRLHGIGDPNCPQRLQQKQMIEGWANVANKLGYYMYMYDLAEATVPVCQVDRLKRDIPYLYRKGCVGMTQEVLTNWHLYGPHIHLGLKLMVDPTADADAIMDDYHEKFFGPQAAPHMKEYWTAIDNAVTKLDCHCGSFFWVHLVYTPEFLAQLKTILDTAASAAKDNPRYAERVAMHTEGYLSAVDYTQMRDAINRGDFNKAQMIYAAFHDRLATIIKKGWANPEYGASYMKRFNLATVEMGQKLTSAPNKLLQILPDEWRLNYDPGDKGIENNFFARTFDDTSWKTVSTYVRPLSAQSLPDRTEVMWFRTAFDVPADAKQLSLFFGEVDGLSEVYVNGQKVEGVVPNRRRQPFEVNVTSAAKPGKNMIAVRVDHTRITELNLGGIIRPVYLIEKPE